MNPGSVLSAKVPFMVFLTSALAVGVPAGRIAESPAPRTGSGRLLTSPTDTVVVPVTIPQPRRLGRLVPAIRIGGVDAPPDRSFGDVADVAVDGQLSMYVVDASIGTVNKYDSTGSYRGMIGKRGQGPGEYSLPHALAVGPSGDLVVVEQRGRKVHVFNGNGTWTRSFGTPELLSAPPGAAIVRPYVTIDASGRLWLPQELQLTASDGSDSSYARMQFILVGLDGQVVDTVREPTNSHGHPTLRVSTRSGNAVRIRVPFSSAYVRRVSPLGYFVTGLAVLHPEHYHIDLLPPAAEASRSRRTVVHRLRVPFDPPAVLPGEGRDWKANLQAVMQWYSGPAGWRWNSSDVPRTKAPYTDVLVGVDGRIFVKLASMAELNAEAGTTWRREQGGFPDPGWAESRWRERVEYDVLDPTGRYIGRITAPQGVTLLGARGDAVWGVENTDGMRLTAVRYRITWN